MFARRATFVETILTFNPDLPSSRRAPKSTKSGPQTFPTKDTAQVEIAKFSSHRLGCRLACDPGGRFGCTLTEGSAQGMAAASATGLAVACVQSTGA